jgi:CxxC-x17-CxxC domain-containing protein
MGHFQGHGNKGGGYKGSNGGGKPSFEKKRWGGDRDNGPTMLHKAVCSECGKNCAVPFRPSGNKPVFCSECFSKIRDTEGPAPRKEFGDRGPRRDFGSRPAPRQDFRPAAPHAHDDSKKQFAEINMKLDRLINSLEKLLQGGKTEAAPVVKATPLISPKEETKKNSSVKPLAKKESAKKIVVKKKK